MAVLNTALQPNHHDRFFKTHGLAKRTCLVRLKYVVVVVDVHLEVSAFRREKRNCRCAGRDNHQTQISSMEEVLADRSYPPRYNRCVLALQACRGGERLNRGCVQLAHFYNFVVVTNGSALLDLGVEGLPIE